MHSLARADSVSAELAKLINFLRASVREQQERRIRELEAELAAARGEGPEEQTQ